MYDPANKNDRVGLLDPVVEEVNTQTELSVAAYLSPSPMTARSDIAALRDIFEQGEAFARRVRIDGADRPAFTTLVVTPEWLTQDLEQLVTCIANHPHPIALVPASYGDLFNDAAHVEGIIACLEAAAGAMMLRCDLSGIGLVAHGASVVGIGTTTATRHRYLPRAAKGRRGDREGRPRVVLMSELLAFLRMDDLVIHEGDPVLGLCLLVLRGGQPAPVRRTGPCPRGRSAHRGGLAPGARLDLGPGHRFAAEGVAAHVR